MITSIGSYLSLEFNPISSYIYYKDSQYINTGRNAFEYILKSKDVRKVFIPYLCCDALLSPLIKNHIEYEYYYVDINHRPIWDFRKLGEKEYFLYINYYGLRNIVIQELSEKIDNLIIDNTQAFFSKPYQKLPTFYSTRKFFGVADGALLCNVENMIELEQDKSADRMKHLLLRVENPSEVGHKTYQENEELLDTLPLMLMSELTKKILLSVNFEHHKLVRNNNFNFLNKSLNKYNKFNINEINGPLSYPLWVNNGPEIRRALKDNRVFTPIFWNSVLDNVPKDSIEYDIVINTIPIPIDGRYSQDDLQQVIDVVNPFLNGN